MAPVTYLFYRAPLMTERLITHVTVLVVNFQVNNNFYFSGFLQPIHLDSITVHKWTPALMLFNNPILSHGHPMIAIPPGPTCYSEPRLHLRPITT